MRRLLEALAEKVDWERVIDESGDRIRDTWAPLLAVNEMLGGEWEPYAREQMERATANLIQGHQEESSQAVYRAMLSLALADTLLEPDERVRLGDIVRRLQEGQDLNSWQVGQLLRGMGFETKTAGGTQYVYTGGEEKLVEVGLLLGIEDEWFIGKMQLPPAQEGGV